MSKVSRKAHLREQRNIDRCRNVSGRIKKFCTLSLQLLVLIKNDCNGRKRYLAVILAHKKGKVHKLIDHIGIGKSQQCLLGGVRRRHIVDSGRDNKLARCPVGDNRTHDACYQDKQNSTVKHILVKQTRAVGKNYAMTDNRCGKGCCSLRGA